MSNTANKANNSQADEDDEPDDWDKRIFSTGCSAEQTSLNDCYFEKKDWRLCKKETASNTNTSPLRAAFTSSSQYQAQPVANSTGKPAARYTPPSPSKPAYDNASPPPSNPNPTPSTKDTQDLSEGLDDQPVLLDEGERQIDWARSFHGLSAEPFAKEAADTLLTPIPFDDVEIKPDGIIYLPEIKYRRILNKAFGPGGWGLAPRGETIVTAKAVTREYALLAHGRLVSVARGEMDYFAPEGIPTAAEGCKSNAMMRCCKDLGVASELWDPRYIRKFKTEHAKEIFVEHVPTKKRKKIWMRKDDKPSYPFQEVKSYGV